MLTNHQNFIFQYLRREAVLSTYQRKIELTFCQNTQLTSKLQKYSEVREVWGNNINESYIKINDFLSAYPSTGWKQESKTNEIETIDIVVNVKVWV